MKKTCSYCDKEFESRSIKHDICGDRSCRLVKRRARKAERRPEIQEKPCVVCKGLFKPKHPNQILCNVKRKNCERIWERKQEKKRKDAKKQISKRNSANLNKVNRHQWQWLILRALHHEHGKPNFNKTSDGTIDGWFKEAVVQVKLLEKGNKLGLRQFKEFHSALHKSSKRAGFYVTNNGYTKPVEKEAQKWKADGIDIQLLTLDDVIKHNFREPKIT